VHALHTQPFVPPPILYPANPPSLAAAGEGVSVLEHAPITTYTPLATAYPPSAPFPVEPHTASALRARAHAPMQTSNLAASSSTRPPAASKQLHGASGSNARQLEVMPTPVPGVPPTPVPSQLSGGFAQSFVESTERLRLHASHVCFSCPPAGHFAWLFILKVSCLSG
jgi:hypothetical protein